jgi:hypothetical protein
MMKSEQKEQQKRTKVIVKIKKRELNKYITDRESKERKYIIIINTTENKILT